MTENREGKETIGQKPNIVFFNGFASGEHVYSPFTSSLSRLGTVVQDAKIGIQDFKKAEDQNFLDNLPDNCILVAHSGGCIPAIEVAKRSRGKVKRMALLMPVGLSERPMAEWVKSFAGHTLDIQMNPELTFPVDKDFTRDLLSRKKDLVEQGLDLTKYNLSEQLQTLSIPTLIIYSDKDRLVGLPDQLSLQNLAKQGNVEIEKVSGGHYWPVSNPDLAERRIRKFAE